MLYPNLCWIEKCLSCPGEIPGGSRWHLLIQINNSNRIRHTQIPGRQGLFLPRWINSFFCDLWMICGCFMMMLKNDEKRWWNSLRKSLRNVYFGWTLMKWGGLPLMKLPNSIKFSVTSWKVSGFRHIPNHSSVDPLFTSLLELKGSGSSVSSRT